MLFIVLWTEDTTVRRDIRFKTRSRRTPHYRYRSATVWTIRKDSIPGMLRWWPGRQRRMEKLQVEWNKLFALSRQPQRSGEQQRRTAGAWKLSGRGLGTTHEIWVSLRSSFCLSLAYCQFHFKSKQVFTERQLFFFLPGSLVPTQDCLRSVLW